MGLKFPSVIPKNIWERLGLRVGDYVEVEAERGRVVIKPKKLVDADLVLTPEEELLVRKGREELRRGECSTLEELDHELDDPAFQRGRQTTQRTPR